MHSRQQIFDRIFAKISVYDLRRIRIFSLSTLLSSSLSSGFIQNVCLAYPCFSLFRWSSASVRALAGPHNTSAGLPRQGRSQNFFLPKQDWKSNDPIWLMQIICQSPIIWWAVGGGDNKNGMSSNAQIPRGSPYSTRYRVSSSTRHISIEPLTFAQTSNFIFGKRVTMPIIQI